MDFTNFYTFSDNFLCYFSIFSRNFYWNLYGQLAWHKFICTESCLVNDQIKGNDLGALPAPPPVCMFCHLFYLQKANHKDSSIFHVCTLSEQLWHSHTSTPSPSTPHNTQIHIKTLVLVRIIINNHWMENAYCFLFWSLPKITLSRAKTWRTLQRAHDYRILVGRQP